MPVTEPNAYPSRTSTAAPGNQLTSLLINSIQDGIIAVSNALKLLAEQINQKIAETQTATGNQTDSPAADVGGAKTIWFEKSTNGTTEVVLDNSIDWRDRYIIVTIGQQPATSIPGGATDNNLSILLDSGAARKVFHLAYTEQGQNGTVGAPGVSDAAVLLGGSDIVRVYARNTDGALCMRKSANADGDTFILGKVECSPVQNHY